MKTIAAYLEWALQFELLAADETDPKQKDLLKQQAAAYHKLAEERAAAVKLSPVMSPECGTRANRRSSLSSNQTN